MSNTRRAAIRISSAFAATALITVASGASAQAASSPIDNLTGGLPAVGSVTSTVTSLTGGLPVVGSATGGAAGATSVADDLPVVGDALGGGDGLLGGDLLGDDLLGDEDGLLDTVNDEILDPVLDAVDDLVDTVADDVIDPVLDTVTEVVDDVTDTVVDVVDDVTDTVDDLLDDEDEVAGVTTTKPVKRTIVKDNGDNGATPVGGVRAGALPHTGASALPLYLLAGGAAMAAGGVGVRRFIVRGN